MDVASTGRAEGEGVEVLCLAKCLQEPQNKTDPASNIRVGL
ncbi:MAG: hypothetical protein NTX45_21140 [Proteobacteria bacterium]|nr:hypothetical protein [Pseudomonadota bacterium]